MSIIRPPVSGDSPQDSWANQVTEAINKGLLAPSINAATPAANINLNGISAATIYLYTRTVTATAPAAVDVDITYDYKNISYSPSPPFGTANWQLSPPSTVNGDYLWVTVVNISANVEKEIIPFASWSTPTIFTVNGSSSFVCEAFIRSATTPGQPSGGSYNFNTTTLTPPTGSPASEVWSSAIPGGTDPVYICTAIAVITGSTGTDNSLAWSQPVKMVENGADGTNGLTGASTDIIFQRSATQPATPSASAGTPSGWYSSASSATGTDLLWAASGTKTVGSSTFTWSAPFQIEGKAVAEVAIYRLNSNAGLTSSTYDFTTNTLTPPTGWSTSVPALSGTGDVIYRASGIVSGSALETSATVTYGSAVIFAQRTDGLTGASTNIIFQRSASAPTTPSASAGVPSGWYDSASGAIGTDVLWAASGTKAIGATNFTWTTPFQIEGEAITEVAVYRLNSNAGLTSSTYDFTTNTLTPPTGWSINAPALVSNGDVIYRASGIASGSSLKTSATVSFGTPVVFAQRIDGATGASSNIIFQRSATAPSTPSSSAGVPTGWYDSASGAIGTDVLWAASGTKAIGATNFTWTTPFRIEGEAVVEVAVYRLNNNTGLATGTYNFATNTLTPPTNWSTTLPSIVSNGDIVYRASGIASGSAIETSASVTFGTPVVFAQRVDGAAGAAGATGASTNIVFQRSATAPSTPSTSVGVPSGWYDSASGAAGTDILWASSGVKAVGANTFTWTTPFQIEGKAVAEVAIYRLNSNSGLVSSTYNFVTNTLTPPTGWSTTAPTLTSNNDIVYRASGIASGSALETSATVTYGSSVVFAQRTDGLTGASTNIIFRRSATAPSTPSASAGVPLDWYDSASSATGTDLLWASSGVKAINATAFVWSTPFQIEGKAIAEVAVYRLNDNTGLTSSTYNFVTNTLTPPTNWSISAPTLSANGDIVYRASGVASGSALQTAASVTFGNPVKFAEKTNGLAGADIESGLVYYSTPSASSPGTPSASDYDFDTGIFTNLTSGWQTQPVVVNITSTTALFWSARYRIIKGPTNSTATVSFNAPIASVNFGTNIQSDNYVTGSSGWQIQRASGNAEFNNVEIRGGLITPSIISAAITSKSITADQIDVDTLVIGSKNILTLDGSAIATRTHRTTIDDYTDGLNNLIVGSGSANGSVVTSGSATTNLRYRFSVQVDLSSNSGTNNLRTKRFYYPVFTANTGYSIDGGNIEVFIVDDITSAQTTNFYVGVDGVDFYSAGPNNNSRQEVLGIGTSMYLNQAEILRLIDPAVEFNAAQAGQRFEVKFTADGTNIPSFTAFSLQAYAVNIEEFFEQSIPGLYNYTNTYEQITNVQLTGTTSTTAYATSVGTTSLTTNGSGTIYGIVRGF